MIRSIASCVRSISRLQSRASAAADNDYNVFKAEIEKDESLTEEQRAKKLQDKFTEVQSFIDQKREGSRLWKLSNRCIYGTDANDRMARTSKMTLFGLANLMIAKRRLLAFSAQGAS